MVQWIRIHLPVQGPWVQSLIREVSTRCWAAESMHDSEATPRAHRLLNSHTESVCSTAKGATTGRSPLTTKESSPAHGNQRKSVQRNGDPVQPKINTSLKSKMQFFFSVVFGSFPLYLSFKNVFFIFSLNVHFCFLIFSPILIFSKWMLFYPL